MKYKVLGLTMAALMLLCAAAASAFEAEEGPYRYHQHLEDPGYTPCADHGEEVFCSHLPLVIIDTRGQAIPGALTGETDTYGETINTLASDGRDVIDADLTIIDNAEGNNHLSDVPAVETITEIRIRGHASRAFEKSPYRLNFVDEDGLDRNIEVMGMGAHSDWVLYGPYLDKSLVRNYMWYNISGELMEWAPNVRYCELFVNNEYRGLYLMVETITNGTNCRLNLTDDAYGTRVTGYLLRGDRTTQEDVDGIRDIYSYLERMITLRTDIGIRYPKRAMLTEEMREQIELDWARFEKALYSYDYDTDDYGYWNYIDVDNFIGYFWVNEFPLNMDAGRYSTYIYKDMSGLYKLAVWDFNNACDNFPEDVVSFEGFDLISENLYYMLFKDEDFVEQVIERYWELRETYFSDEYLMDYIDETLEWLGPAVERNSECWAKAMEEDMLRPAERNVHSHEEAVEQLKDWLLQRGKWLDDSVHALNQYAHPSRNKTYNH